MRHASLAGFTFDLSAIFETAVDLGLAVIQNEETQKELVHRGRVLAVLNPRGRWFGSDPLFHPSQAYPASRQTSVIAPRHFDEVDAALGLSSDARAALKTIAGGVVLLSESDPFRTRGRELLGSGVWLLWQGMSADDRARVHIRVDDAADLWGWGRTRGCKVARHRGPLLENLDGFPLLNLSRWEFFYGERAERRGLARRPHLDREREHGRAAWSRVHHGGSEFVEITGMSCIVIPGSIPTICPAADPSIPPTQLPHFESQVRKFVELPVGLTIHWIGHTAGSRGHCPCHPAAPTASPIDRGRWPVPMAHPVWDRTKLELRFRGVTIANYPTKPAPIQWEVLDAFETAGWREKVVVTTGGRPLKNGIDALNQKIKEQRVIKFAVMSRSKTVRWSIITPSQVGGNNRG